MSETLPDFAAIAGELAGRGVESGAFTSLDDDALLAAIEAAELSRRSRVGFGQRGLAQRSGYANTGDLLQSITRSSRRDTAALVEVGQMIAEADASNDLARARRADAALADLVPDVPPPWFAELGTAVATGALTVAVADAIR